METAVYTRHNTMSATAFIFVVSMKRIPSMSGMNGMNGMKGMPTMGGMYGMNRPLDWEHLLRHDIWLQKKAGITSQINL